MNPILKVISLILLILLLPIFLTSCLNGNPLILIGITPVDPSIAFGKTQQFTANGIYLDMSTKDVTAAVTWTSSSSNVATINSAGLATAVGGGTTTITAVSGTITNSVTLTVTGPALTSIVITPANPYVEINKTLQFTATGTFSDSTTHDITTLVTWSSSDSAKATISSASGSNGLAAGVGVGTSTITASLGSLSGTAALTVIAPVTPSIAGGYGHTIALKSDGTVWAWGDNYHGGLGNITNVGTNNPNPTPTQVSGLTGITAIAGGSLYTIVLKSDGTVWAWGDNWFGELGNSTNVGTTNPNPTPTQVSGLTGVTAIATSTNHALALKLDGTVWAWGGNYLGQLGNNSTTNSSTPVEVLGAGGVGYLNLN